MGLIEEFDEKVRAGVAGIQIQSFEHGDAFKAIYRHCTSQDWQFGSFDYNLGVRSYNKLPTGDWVAVNRWFEPDSKGGFVSKNYDPNKFMDAAAVVKYAEGLKTLAKSDQLARWDGKTPCVLVIKNPEFWYAQPAFVQTVADCLYDNKVKNVYLVFLTTTATLPLQLQKLFEAGHIRHELPDRKAIESIVARVDGVKDETPFLKDEVFREKVVDAAAGLTRLGVEDAVSISMTRHDSIDPHIMFDLKAKAFANSINGLEIHLGTESFDTYGGASFLKEFAIKLLSRRSDDPKKRSRGIFMVGLPGSGKTFFAKCLGNAVGRPTAIVKMGAMKSSLQGRSFENLKNALNVLEAMQPAIAFFDEVEGQVSGGKSTGALDAGTSSQMNSELLHWLSERTADVFVLASCNDVRALMSEMPEFARMGRFDGLFFLDYPGDKSKEEIWKIHLLSYGFIQPGTPEEIDAQFKKIKLPKTVNWTGAEIEACCRISNLLEVSVAEFGKTMPTIASQAGDQIEAIRQWAEGRCYAAEYNGVYRADKHDAMLAAALSSNGTGRSLLGKPSRN